MIRQQWILLFEMSLVNWGYLVDICWCWCCRQSEKWMEATRVVSPSSCSWGSQSILSSSGFCFGYSCPCTWSWWWEMCPSSWPLAPTPACTRSWTSSWPTSPSPISSLSPTQSPRCWWTFSPRTKPSPTLCPTLTQLYFLVSLVTLDNLLLATMAYDHYVPICRPLHYTTRPWALGFVFHSWPCVGHSPSSMASSTPSSWQGWASVGPRRSITSSVRCPVETRMFQHPSQSYSAYCHRLLHLPHPLWVHAHVLCPDCQSHPPNALSL